MLQRKLIAAVMIGMAVAAAGPALAQDSGAGAGRGGPGGQGGFGGPGGPEMRQQREQQLRDQLGLDETEWEAVKGKIESIRRLQMQLNLGRGPGGPGGPPGGPMGRMDGQGGPGGQGGPDGQMRGPRGGGDGQGKPQGQRGPGGGPGAFGGGPGGPGGEERMTGPVRNASRELQEALTRKDATDEQIGAKAAAVQQARAKVREELKAAQDDLKSTLTVRQQAVLITMGILE